MRTLRGQVKVSASSLVICPFKVMLPLALKVPPSPPCPWPDGDRSRSAVEGSCSGHEDSVLKLVAPRVVVPAAVTVAWNRRRDRHISLLLKPLGATMGYYP